MLSVRHNEEEGKLNNTMTTPRRRYLTKSRFKLAYECPTKLFYEGHPEYKNLKKEDAFLEALAEGGFQVGALAQVMHPGGIEIEERNPDAAAEATAPYLKQENFLLFEPALKHGSFLVRADILERRGDTIFLKEVKAKSWKSGDSFFLKKRGARNKRRMAALFARYSLPNACRIISIS